MFCKSCAVNCHLNSVLKLVISAVQFGLYYRQFYCNAPLFLLFCKWHTINSEMMMMVVVVVMVMMMVMMMMMMMSNWMHTCDYICTFYLLIFLL